MSLVDDLPKAFAAFYDDEAARTCPGCGWVHPGRGRAARPAARADALPAPGVGVTVVDLHSHFFPETWPDLAERFGTPDWPWMRRDGPDRAMVMLGSHEFRPITSACWDAAVRLADMDRDGVDLQVVSATPVLFAYGRPAEHAMECARIFNDALLELCARAAAGSSRSARCHCRTPTWPAASSTAAWPPGMKGVQIGNHVGDRDLDDDGLVDLPRPLRVARRPGVRAPVGHVRRLPAGGLDAGVDGGDAGRDPAVAQPDDPRRGLRPAAPRPAHLLRPRRRVVHLPARPAGERLAPPRHRPGPSTAPPSTYLDRFEVDSAVYDVRALRYLVDVMGPSSVLLGSDYPFPLGEEHVGQVIRSCGFAADVERRLLGGNARRVPRDGGVGPAVADVGIAGAGLAGPLLAVFLARRGHDVTLYERRADPRLAGAAGDRSTSRCRPAASTPSSGSGWPTRSWPTGWPCGAG